MSLRYYITVLIVVSILLLIRFYTFYINIPDISSAQKVTMRTRLTNEPEIVDKTQRFTLVTKTHRIFITTGKYPLYHYGQVLEVKGVLKVSKKAEKIFYSISFPTIREIRNESNYFLYISLWIRNRAIKIFESVLSPTQSALMLGIVFGIKQNMPDEFLEILRDAGVVHVIAASGMNVSMAAGSFFFIFQRFFKRRTALIFSLFGVVLYVFIAGFEPSIVRAAIMAGIAYAAGITGRQKYSIYALFLTAVIMLFISPSWLFDIGFQLSFMATLGIIILKPIFDHGLKRIRGSLKDDFTTTLAAQLATIPILLSGFGSVNLLSILINMLILWTIPILMVIGGISIISGLIFTQLGSFISVFSMPLLIYFEILVRYFDRFKIPLEMEKTSWILWAGYYLILSAIVVHAGNKRKVKSDW